LKSTQKLFFTIVFILIVVIYINCENNITDEDHHGEEGEETGTKYGLNETYDHVRNGIRLILAYDMQSNSFIGSVENTTDQTVQQVRVEVHLSNGTELGPTTPVDLAPDEKRDITLTATSTNFTWWSTHVEIG